MQPLTQSARSNTLRNKANAGHPDGSRRSAVDLKIASELGMDAETSEALERICGMAKSRKIGVAGRFLPDAGASARLASLGITEHVDEADFFRYHRIVIPYGGVTARQRRAWEEEGYPLEDLTSPRVRRAQVALGLLKMEGAQPLVIGRHDDQESFSISGGCSGSVLQDTTDIARLRFAPAFGVVCQTTLSPRRVSWLVQQLRLRWRDARVTFLDTVSPAMAAREEALERLLVVCDRVVIVGEAGEASCEALVETTLRRGKAAVIVTSADELAALDFKNEKVALTAGAFATHEAVLAVAAGLAGR